MLSNEELFAKAYHALWLYQLDLDTPLSSEEQEQFVREFIASEQKTASTFRL
jgi:hypothetical protein